jgi:uncharacterized membrane protein YraQ (UPF0718 family)
VSPDSGVCLSAVVQAAVSKSEMSRLLPDDSPRTLCVATGLGAASSSCSYAAVALARSIFRKGGNFTAAMAFEFASTNLVIELGIILAVLIGWQFTLAEFIGGPLMIVLLAVVFRLFLRTKLVAAAREQADMGISGRMEGHADIGDAQLHERAQHPVPGPRGGAARPVLPYWRSRDVAHDERTRRARPRRRPTPGRLKSSGAEPAGPRAEQAEKRTAPASSVKVLALIEAD